MAGAASDAASTTHRHANGPDRSTTTPDITKETVVTPASANAPTAARQPPDPATGTPAQHPASSTSTTTIGRHEPLSTRDATRADIVHRNTMQGQSINESRHAIRRSYGFVRRRLVDSRVRMRPRGGNTSKPAGQNR